jgi:hypothetical protein
MIDICTVAILRSEILEQTYKSFIDRCLHEYPCRLILNIDDLGSDGINNVIITAQKYFAEVKWNWSGKQSCMGAWKWCWQNTTADVVLWLEDDWILTRDIDLSEILDIMSAPNMGGLRLLKRESRADEYRIGKCGNTQASMWWDENESLFEITDDNIKTRFGITGNPCFYNGKLLRKIADKLDSNAPQHPEKFIRYSPICGEILLPYRYCAYGKPLQSPTVEDIGYGWRVDNGFNRKIGKGWRK